MHTPSSGLHRAPPTFAHSRSLVHATHWLSVDSPSSELQEMLDTAAIVSIHTSNVWHSLTHLLMGSGLSMRRATSY
jgi:hypothetical protein